MKERPIIFNGNMVKAILEGRKTQTRRIIKPQPVAEFYKADGGTQQKVSENRYRSAPGWDNDRFMILRKDQNARGATPELWAMLNCPFGQPGDRLWVRETWDSVGMKNPTATVIYRADGDKADSWKPSIHMPRWASRITLEITCVRVERLQDITEQDAKAEGVDRAFNQGHTGLFAGDYTAPFKWAWDDCYGSGAWEQNPWVWVIDFTRVPN